MLNPCRSRRVAGMKPQISLVVSQKARRREGTPDRWGAAMVAVLLVLIGCHGAIEAGKDSTMAKISPELVRLYDEYVSYLAQRNGAAFRPSSPLMRVVDERVVIDAVASGDVSVLRSDLVALGMKEAVSYGRIVSGELPIPAIRSLTGVGSLRFAQPATAILQNGQGRPTSGQGPRLR